MRENDEEDEAEQNEELESFLEEIRIGLNRKDLKLTSFYFVARYYRYHWFTSIIIRLQKFEQNNETLPSFPEIEFESPEEEDYAVRIYTLAVLCGRLPEIQKFLLEFDSGKFSAQELIIQILTDPRFSMRAMKIINQIQQKLKNGTL